VLDPGEHALLRRALLRLLGLLDVLPLREDLLGSVDALGVSEDVGVAAHELVGDRGDGVVDRERALALADRGLKHDLHQQIAELLAVIRRVVAAHRIEHLVGLLDQERAQRVERLLAVPRAAVGGEQSVHDVDELAQRGDPRAAMRAP
jgi:hypothetical protein